MTSPPLIEVKNISRTYHAEEVSTTALHSTSFAVTSGEFVAIMGPSGSGKSTLLHLLGLLDRPSTGHYFFAGQDTGQLSDLSLARLRNRKIGFIFQAFHFLPRTSVLDNVILPLNYSRLPAARHRALALAAIKKVGLRHRLDFHPSQLSGGEKQRAVIARALINQPDLLLADEPTGNLDSRTGKMIMDLIAKLHSEGLTVIVITHETPTAGYASRVIRLTDGRIESDQLTSPQQQIYSK